MKKLKWPNSVRFNQQSPAVAGAVTMSAPDGAMCPVEQTERGMAWFAQRGCACKLSSHYWGNAGFLAGSPADIAEDINMLVADPTIDFIISSGGGYCANALLPYLDYDLIGRIGKPIIGLSNPTVLLNAISSKTGLVTYSGPVLIHNLGSEQGIDAFTEQSLRAVLAHDTGSMVITEGSDWKWLRGGRVEGRLWGGNLWSIEHLLGTPYEPEWDGGILMLEDCFCELHQVMASLQHFKTAGVFERLSGLIIGVPLEVGETELPYHGSFADIVSQVVEDCDLVTVDGVHLGHTDRKLTLPIGAMVRLDSTLNQMTLVVE